MDELRLTIQLTTWEERVLINASFPAAKKETKASLLFKIYLQKEELKPREVAMQLLGNENMDAYQDVRKQLRRIVMPIMLRQRSSTQGHSSEANDKLIYSLIFLENKYPEIAVGPLEEAEALALKNRNYYVLEKIYATRLDFAAALNLVPSAVYQKWRYYNNLNSIKISLKYAKSIIIRDVLEARSKGNEMNVEERVNGVLSSGHDIIKEQLIPELSLIVVSTTRAIMMATKSFQQLLPYLLKHYDDLKNANAFTPADAAVEIRFLYFIAHAHYRNLDMTSALEWHTKMMEAVDALPVKGSYDTTTALQLEACIQTFTGHLSTGIRMMNNTLTKKNLICDEDRVNMHVMLAVMYVFKKDFEKALEAISQVTIPVKDQETKMGKEWRLKREMILMIIYYKLGDETKAQKCLDSMIRTYAEMLAQKQYFRTGEFLFILADVLKDGQIVFDPAFHERVQAAKKGWEHTEDDLHAVLFVTWLKAMMLDVDYYELLLERLKKPVRKVENPRHEVLVKLAE